MMNHTIRKAGALGVVMGILAGIVVGMGVLGRDAGAHADPNFPETPTNLRVEGVAGSMHNAVTISWDEEHRHDNGGYFGAYYVYLYIGLPLTGDRDWGRCLNTNSPPPIRCIRRLVKQRRTLTGSRYSIRVSGLAPETTYYVLVRLGSHQVPGATGTITTTASPGIPDPETPDPETPTEPETPTTPDPETQDCTYKHRLIGVPGTTGGGYTSQILISSEASNATATIRAYQSDNGQQIDVLDSEGSAIGSSVSLAPAHSVKRFKLEDARGWHTVIVEHPTARAMRRAMVAMRLREPDTGISIILAERIEDCEPVATTTE